MKDFFDGILAVFIFLFPVAVVIFTLRKLIKIPDELFRKILHFILLAAYIPFLFGFIEWWHCVIFIVGFAIVLFPLLTALRKIPGFSRFVNERKNGEFASSMLLALGVMAGSITVGWGLMSDKYIVLAGVYAWGVGDAFAALIGKRFGKHKITWRFVDNKKSVEGTLAMVITSAISVFTVLVIRGGVSPLWCALISLVVASASAFVELCTKNGYDTVTCPLVSMLLLLPMITLLGG